MKVSIITVVYNNQEYIADCIQSVLNQTYHNIEHIVIDGGSTDGTQKEIEPFEKNLAYYCSEKDRGLYHALNKGILRATGDVIGVLHSDDLFYDKHTVHNIVDTFKKSEAELVYANGLFVDKNNVSNVKRTYKSRPFRRKYLLYGWIPLHTAIYVKRKVFEDHGMYFEHFTIASDYEISLRWFLEPKVRKSFLDKYVVKMRLGGKSTTVGLQRRKGREDMSIIYQHGLPGFLTLGFKMARKIPQYLLPVILPWRYKIGRDFNGTVLTINRKHEKKNGTAERIDPKRHSNMNGHKQKVRVPSQKIIK